MNRLKPVAALALLLALLCGFAMAEENLIVNGGFEEAKDGLPEGWSRGMWFTDEGVSLLTLEDGGVSGQCASVHNVGINDARFAQTVAVEPDTIYHITAQCRAEGIDYAQKGATISFDGTFSYSNELFDTDGRWETLEIYGRTGEEQTSVTVFLRVGGYGSENDGQAWFDDVRMEKTEVVPDGVEVLEMERPAAQEAVVEADDEDVPQRNTQAFLLLIFLWLLLVLAAARKLGRTKVEEGRPYGLLMAALLLFSAALRLVLAAKVPGYNTDINCFTAWAQRMLEQGPMRFYSEGWCDYPPLYMWMLAPIAALTNLMGLDYRTGGQLALIKLWPMLFDLLGGLLIWIRAKKLRGERVALALAALFLLNPAVFTDSAAWGQIDSIFTVLIALAALSVDAGGLLEGMLCFTLAMLIKPQALLFAPLGLVAILTRAFSRRDRRTVKRAALGLGASLLLLYLFGLLSAGGLGQGVLQPVEWLREQYSGTLQGYDYLDVNALNLHYILGGNWVHLGEKPVASTAAWVLFGLSYVFCAVLYLKPSRHRSLVLAGGTLILLICAFGPMIHERYMYPALLLLILAYAETRDRRLLVGVSILSAGLFLNEVLVLQGGMTAYNGGHLQSGEDWLNLPLAAVNVLNTLFVAWTAADILWREHVCPHEPAPLEAESPARRALMGKNDWKLHLKRIDALLMAGMTFAYGTVAFANLGSMKAPQTTWTASETDEAIVFDLGAEETFRLTYYGNICTSNFRVSLSNDGELWTEPCYAQYGAGDIFRWLWFRPLDENGNVIYKTTVPSDHGEASLAYSGWDGESYPFQTARYVRLEAVSPGLKLMEVAFLGSDGQPLPAVILEGAEDASLLLDEQDTAPERPGWYYGTYFDEIYHPRTAYEHLHGLQTYEYTHPPLGKVMMMIGIQLFGMTPFGWRFMGTLMGVLMVPLMYLMVKQLTKRTDLAFIATFLLSVDAMHFTQTRLATIDSYAVFWIMLMYFFMFRYIQMQWRTKADFRRSLLTLGLCGISMGLGWATKWICLYASVGLAALFFWSLTLRAREAREAGEEAEAADSIRVFLKRCLGTLGFCIGFFVVIPLLIYYFSYYWHLQYEGVRSLGDMFSLSRVKDIWNLQLSMYRYHAGLSGDTHPFRSAWYQWPVISWPMWYYSGSDFVPAGQVSSISCMGNPAVFWFCLAAMIFTGIRAAYARRAPKSCVCVIVGFLSQFLPWVLVPRSTFIYHYFASVPFIIIAGALTLDWVKERSRKAFLAAVSVLLLSALALFILFYPLESGMQVSRAYASHLRWFNWVNF